MTVPKPCRDPVRTALAAARRLQQSAVVWHWILNFMRLAFGLILLPLVLNTFTTADLGMYYVFLSLAALVPLVDFGFGPTIGRFVSYAMGGAASLQTQGLTASAVATGPNYALLWQLLYSARSIYRFLLLALVVILGTWGTYLVEIRINETSSPAQVRLAWFVTFAAALFEIYSGWWGVYLRGLNEVFIAARIDVMAMGLRLALAAALLVAGGGLLSIPLATLCSCLLQRQLSRRRCLQLLAGHSPPDTARIKETLAVLWPNTWRTGLIFVGGYLTVNGNTAICLHFFGLEANAQYGLSAQVLNIISGMAGVWTAVKWPILGQLRARHDLDGMLQVLRPRVWLQSLSFIIAAGGVLYFGPSLLDYIGDGKKVLPLGWFSLFAMTAFLDMQLGFWTKVIFLGNRLPFLWPVILSNALSPILSLSLIYFTSLGLGALVLGPFLAGSLFNYWYWPGYACRNLGSGLLELLFRGLAGKSLKITR